MAKRKDVPDSEHSARAQARAWVIREQSGPFDKADRDALEAWLARSDENRRAHERARSLWLGLAPLEEAFAAPAEAPAKRKLGRHAGLGGAIAVLAACLAVLWLGLPGWIVSWQADFSTGTGEQLRADLPDGSIAYLNTASAIDVAFSEDRRVVRLLKGEAYFDVEENPDRPFSVRAAGGAATALGTEFIVRRNEADTRVMTVEGLVGVTHGGGDEPVRLKAGFMTHYSKDGISQAPEAFDVSSAAPWRTGRIVLGDLPLPDAIEELDRYVPGRILLMTEGPFDRVSGVFSVDHAQAAIETLAATHGLRVNRVTPWLVILH
ncbi:FecR family protein [Henriciella aquimarina]|uniref:FecR family protein n=1 Tax=Henriciella aquimarina TaxID=545261 RepID=UPI001301AA6C|nr:FecR domain-containing protein [Henriciella aquimarina]